MHNEFTAVIQQGEKFFVGFCPEVPGANGQGATREECLEDLKAAIELILEVYRDEARERAMPGAEMTTVTVG